MRSRSTETVSPGSTTKTATARRNPMAISDGPGRLPFSGSLGPFWCLGLEYADLRGDHPAAAFSDAGTRTDERLM